MAWKNNKNSLLYFASFIIRSRIFGAQKVLTEQKLDSLASFLQEEALWSNQFFGDMVAE